MNYYLVKPIVLLEGKNTKKVFVVKAESSLMAEATATLNLVGIEIVEIPDINKKNYTDVIVNVNGGVWYEVKCEWDNVDSKIMKEFYLVQHDSTKEAEDVISNLQNCEITGTNKTNIEDYFIQEEEI